MAFPHSPGAVALQLHPAFLDGLAAGPPTLGELVGVAALVFAAMAALSYGISLLDGAVSGDDDLLG